MGFNRRKRDPFGPRFGELMGKECHAALTASARGNREQYDACVQRIYLMLDSIETETNWPDEKTEKKNEPTPVAAEGEPTTTSEGSEAQAVEGPAPARPTRKRTKRANAGKKRNDGPTGPGTSGRKSSVGKPDVDGE